MKSGRCHREWVQGCRTSGKRQGGGRREGGGGGGGESHSTTVEFLVEHGNQSSEKKPQRWRYRSNHSVLSLTEEA